MEDILAFALASVFAFAATSKIFGFDDFVEELQLPSLLRTPLATLTIALEIILAIGLVLEETRWLAALGVILTLTLFTAYILANVLQGKEIECNCFGNVGTGKVDRFTLIRNGLLLILGVGVLLSIDGDQRSAPDQWSFSAWDGLILVLGFGGALVFNLRNRIRFLQSQLKTAAEGIGKVSAFSGSLEEVAATLTEGSKVEMSSGRHIDLAGLGFLLVISPTCGPCRKTLKDLKKQCREDTEHATSGAIVVVNSANNEYPEEFSALIDTSRNQCDTKVFVGGDDFWNLLRLEVTPAMLVIDTQTGSITKLLSGTDEITVSLSGLTRR